MPGLQGWIDDGWVVVATDYQGLGTPGMHQYTVNITNARDGIYAAHAARKLETDAGTAVGCAGLVWGSGAAAAIAELDAADYGDLKLIGTVCMSPGVTKVGLEILPDDHRAHRRQGHTGLASGDAAGRRAGCEINETATGQRSHRSGSTSSTPPGTSAGAPPSPRLFRLKGAVLNPTPPNFPAWKEAIIASSAAQKKPSHRCWCASTPSTAAR